MAIGIIAVIFFFFFILLMANAKNLFCRCAPNEVLVFSGPSSKVGDKRFGYRVISGGGFRIRIPLLEKVDRLDLTNMIIELSANGAYAKGGVPVNIHGVANVKVASHEPMLNNAIERFLGKSRAEIMAISQATLEGALRGVLATLTPEQLNEDRAMLDQQLVLEAEQDMSALGLVVDSLKIQNITDDVKYLDSIGRIRNAELLSSARKAEAIAHADSQVREAENDQKENRAQITAQIEIAKANAERAIADALTRREAVVAEEKAAVAALVAQAESDIPVQKARIEQLKQKLQADVITPARAEYEAAEQAARGSVAPIVEDGRARADALTRLSESWSDAGDQAREIFIIQKIVPVINQLTDTISQTKIDKVTVIDTDSSGGKGSIDSGRLLALSEQVKEVFGVDLVGKLQDFAPAEDGNTLPAASVVESDSPPPVPPKVD
jgi:flotillin